MKKLLPDGFKPVNYRTSRGNENDCYSFDVKRGRTLVCEVTYDGWGGPVDVHWKDEAGAAAVEAHAFRAIADYLADDERNPSIGGVEPNPEAAAKFDAVTTWDELQALCSAVSADEFWAEQVAQACEDAKEVKKLIKAATAKTIVVRSDQPGTYTTFKAAPTPVTMAKVEKHFAKLGVAWQHITAANLAEHGMDAFTMASSVFAK